MNSREKSKLLAGFNTIASALDVPVADVIKTFERELMSSEEVAEMIGDLKKEYCDCGGLGMKIEKDPLQIGDMRNGTLYTFGESTIEVDMPKDAEGKAAFERITGDT